MSDQTTSDQTTSDQTTGTQTANDQKTRMRERTLAFFQENKDPLGEYCLLVRDLYLDIFRDTQRVRRNIEMTLDILADCYLNKMSLEEVACARNMTRERVRMIKERAVAYVQKRCLIDLHELLRLIKEAERGSARAHAEDDAQPEEG